MTGISVYLLQGSRLQHEGVRQLLAPHPVEVVGEGYWPDDLRRDLASGLAPGCILLDVDRAADVSALIAEVRALVRPPRGLVAFAGEITETLLWQVAEGGADGLLDKSGCGAAMASALCLVELGQKVFPTALLLDRLAALMAAEPVLTAPVDVPLSPRECEVLRQLTTGRGNRAIADRLGISQATVKNHLKRIQNKLKVGNRTQAAIWALRHGLAAPAAAAAGDTGTPAGPRPGEQPPPAVAVRKAPLPRPGGQAADRWSRLAAALTD